MENLLYKHDKSLFLISALILIFLAVLLIIGKIDIALISIFSLLIICLCLIFTPRTGTAGIVGGVFGIAALICVLVTIAIPQFQHYRMRAQASVIKSELSTVKQLEEEYYSNKKAYTTDLKTLGYSPKTGNVEVLVTYADDNCFHAEGSGRSFEKVINMDCNGFY